MSSLNSLRTKFEAKGNELFVKKAPFQIPENGRKTLVQWSPWISLVVGLFGLLASLFLWQAAHTVNTIVTYVNSYNYSAPVQHLGLFFWLSMLALLFSSVLMLASVPGLKNRSKSRGWDLAMLGVLFNFVYGLVYVFSSLGGGLGRLIGSLISLVIGLYLLFQIRSFYTDKVVKSETPKKD
jgi:hypothetical protein